MHCVGGLCDPCDHPPRRWGASYHLPHRTSSLEAAPLPCPPLPCPFPLPQGSSLPPSPGVFRLEPVGPPFILICTQCLQSQAQESEVSAP